ncbi:MAG: M23 family metallopeptidase [Clostridia bacterium]|nr:M23 family metallopeptidase [Clostridia bacterium]
MKRTAQKTIALILAICLSLLCGTSLANDDSIGEQGSAEQWLWPAQDCYTISSNYGYRFGGSDRHRGIDIVSGRAGKSRGSSILAAKSGTIYKARDCYGDEEYIENSLGNYVMIDHGDGTCSLYAHLMRKGIKTSGEVKQGECIGYMGDSGESTGYHLHFQIYTDKDNANGSTLNPMPTNENIVQRNGYYRLPEGWCEDKITYIMPPCEHEYNSEGVCEKCSDISGTIARRAKFQSVPFTEPWHTIPNPRFDKIQSPF